MKTPDERMAEYLGATPIKYRGQIERAMRKEGSPRQAIKAKCLDCSGFNRVEVANCTVILCPLHPWRPYQDEKGISSTPEARGDELGDETDEEGMSDPPEAGETA